LATYIILSRFTTQAFSDPAQFKDRAARVKEQIKQDCPGLNWRESYAVMGRFDLVDIVEADDPGQVARAAMIIQGYGQTKTETLPAIGWDDFLAGL
jgi:uncharacterized protein with GYD domain